MAHFEDIYNDAYAVYMWTDWKDPEMLTQVSNKVGDTNYQDFSQVTTYHNATAATEDATPLAALPVPYVAPQSGVAAPWHRRLTNYGLGLSGFNGAEIETEYFVALSKAPAAIQALKPLAAKMNAIAYVSLFRMVAPDDMWMSTANGDNVNGER